MSLKLSLTSHWPEYLIEFWASGSFMVAVGFLVTAFGCPGSPLLAFIPIAQVRVALLALAIGLVLTLLIQSPWGKRSGAHMNPAITLAFLRLKKIHPWDAFFYVIAQTLGGTLGIVVVAVFVGEPFTEPPVRYAVTMPGAHGDLIAFLAEMMISFALMTMILVFTSTPHLSQFTGVAIGGLVALLIIVEAPLSGTSMNPARTLASAVPGMMWQHLWLYLLGPTLGMLAAAQIQLCARSRNISVCAKMLHPRNVRCIHCGYLCPGS